MGEPVHVLTPEEQATEQQERRSNAAVEVSGVQCWCGAKRKFRRNPFWMFSGDSVVIDCRRRHRSVLRYTPETVSR